MVRWRHHAGLTFSLYSFYPTLLRICMIQVSYIQWSGKYWYKKSVWLLAAVKRLEQGIGYQKMCIIFPQSHCQIKLYSVIVILFTLLDIFHS